MSAGANVNAELSVRKSPPSQCVIPRHVWVVLAEENRQRTLQRRRWLEDVLARHAELGANGRKHQVAQLGMLHQKLRRVDAKGTHQIREHRDGLLVDGPVPVEFRMLFQAA